MAKAYGRLRKMPEVCEAAPSEPQTIIPRAIVRDDYFYDPIFIEKRKRHLEALKSYGYVPHRGWYP